MIRAECQRCRELMDSYVSNELLVETNLEVIHHLDGCAECRVHAEARRRTRELLRNSIRDERAPQMLHDRIAAALANEIPVPTRPSRLWSFRRSVLGAAAVVVVLLLIAPATRAWMESAAKAAIAVVSDRFGDREKTTAPPLPSAVAPIALAPPLDAPVPSRPLSPKAVTNPTPTFEDLALLEVETLARLDSVGVLLGGQIEVTRSTSRVLVRGLVEDNEKRRTIRQALSPLASRSLRIELRTIGEALEQLPQPSGALQFKPIDFDPSGIPAASDLRSHLARVSPAADVEAEVRRMATTALRQSRAALLHALALESIAERYQPKALQDTSPKAYAVWMRLLASQGASFAEQTRKLRAQLEPVFLSPSASMPEIDGEEVGDSAGLAARLARLAVTMDDAIRAGLTASTERVARVQIREPEFWQTVRRAERLALSFTQEPRQ
jgi:Putative zinc-finger